MRKTVFGLIFLLASCGGGGGSSGGGSSDSNSSKNPSPQPANQISVATTLAALESSGQLPVLDHSAGLGGTDTNSNGVRDDIDTWITRQNVSIPQQSALTQHARSLQSALVVDLNAPVAVSNASLAIGRGIACIWSRFDNATANRVAGDLEKFTVNTKERAIVYMKFSIALSGSVLAMPEGATCDQ